MPQQKYPIHGLTIFMMSLLLLQLPKASGNIKFICQQLNTFALIKELALAQNTTSKSKTYTEVKKTNDQVFLITLHSLKTHLI